MTQPAPLLCDAPAGLLPAIVQDVRTGAVLMLAYMNQAAYDLTVETGQVHFWSRSRNELWQKGATSGNTLTVNDPDSDIRVDCDLDTILIAASPAGPACHTGQSSCFGSDIPQQGFFGLEALWDTISDRAELRPSSSYTTELLEGGVDLTGRKVLEEAGELVFAAKNHAVGTDSDARVASEAADLMFHLMVLLAERGVQPRLVMDELADRAAGTGS